MRRAVVAVVTVALAGAACSGGTSGSRARSSIETAGGRWRVVAEAPLAGAYGYDAVWTGQEIVVWGGARPARRALRTVAQRRGAAYDPRTDTWRVVPEAPIRGGTGYSLTWTGTEMLVWGDPDRGRSTRGNRGAAYDPAANEWRRIPPGPLEGRSGHLAVWTGDELVVWGGYLTSFRREAYDGKGAAFDPATDRWRMLPDAPLPAGYDSMGAWTGREVLVMTSPPGTDAGDYPKFDHLAAYDPKSDAWRSLARPPHVSYAGPPVDYVDGKLVVLSLGGTVDGGEVGGYGRDYDTGGVYDYASDEWSPHAEPPGSLERPDQTWQQTAMGDAIVVDGLVYVPSTDTWRTLPEYPLRAREFPVVVWTGDELVVWGGAELTAGDPPPPLDDGAAYTPPRTPR
jgi:hypothetical protein